MDSNTCPTAGVRFGMKCPPAQDVGAGTLRSRTNGAGAGAAVAAAVEQEEIIWASLQIPDKAKLGKLEGVKPWARTVEKLMRCYAGDASCILDCCRCVPCFSIDIFEHQCLCAFKSNLAKQAQQFRFLLTHTHL